MASSTLLLAQRDKKRKSNNSAPNENTLREAEFFFTEGEKHYILEDYTKALLYYQRTAELNPTNPTVHYKIADVFSKNKNEEDLIKASVSIEAAIQLDPTNKYFYLLASSIFANLNKYDKAQSALEKMMKEVPGTEEYLYELAVLYIYDKKPSEAIRIYNEIEALYGVNEISAQQKQTLYTEQGKIDMAIAEGEKLIEAFPDEEQYVLAFAEFLSTQNQRERSTRLLSDYLKDHPESGSAKMLLAGIYRDNGQEKKARELIISTIDDPTVEVGSKVLMVAIYLNQFTEQKKRPTTKDSLQQFLELAMSKLVLQHPKDPNVFLIAGDFMLSVANEKEACTNYQRAIQNGSTSFDAWQNLMVLESKLNLLDSLLKHSDSGLELFPNQPIVYYFNGYAHFRKKHYKESAYALEQAKKIAVSNLQLIFEINNLLGEVYNGSKEYTKSDKAYEDALTFKPTDEVTLNNYSYYLALRKENLEKAEKMSAQLVKDHPANPTYLDTHAWVLFMREKYKDARKVIEKAISSGGSSAIYFEHYGDILFKLGEVDEAVKQWKQAKTLDSKNELIDKKIANRKIN